MRENRLYGSEGGAAELNRSSLPLSLSDGTAAYACYIVGRRSGVCLLHSRGLHRETDEPQQ